MRIKPLLFSYLSQLTIILEKIPEHIYPNTLHEGMFSLEVNAQIAANFLLRGYCPLIGENVVLEEAQGAGKTATLSLVKRVEDTLIAYPEYDALNDSINHQEKAGFNEVELSQSDFIHQYIIPNYMFHMSLVYAIARHNGVALSKGDFDGLHSYPEDFSFLDERQ